MDECKVSFAYREGDHNTPTMFAASIDGVRGDIMNGSLENVVDQVLQKVNRRGIDKRLKPQYADEVTDKMRAYVEELFRGHNFIHGF